MSLKVLLADDNITAQRLGSKILSDAGFAVIAVSNGAAAVKKIASDKPDLLILDVYMPGYTGLEVCEKVKNDPATAQTPVILTVTNMEPFNQADGNRVRADGVMVKPFEASDLLAVVQKLGARHAKATAAEADRTVKMAAMQEFKDDATYEEWKSEAPEEEEPKKIEMSAEVAAAPALGFDDEPAPAPMEAAPVAPETPAFAMEEHSSTFGMEASAPAFNIDDTPTASLDLTQPLSDFAPISVEAHAETAPTIDAHAELAPPAEFEPTSAPSIDVQVTQAAELESLDVSVPDVVAQDPALVTDADEMSQFVTSVGVEHPEDIPVGVALPGLSVPEEEQSAPVEEHVDAGYATTVKLNAYVDTVPEPEAPVEAVAEPSHVETEMQSAFAVGSSGAAAAPALESEPGQPPHPAADLPPIPDHLVQQFQAELDQAHEERQAMGIPETPIAEAMPIDSTIPIAPEVPASQIDDEKIAAAVNRALEKYKEGLRAELIQSIVRELKG